MPARSAGLFGAGPFATRWKPPDQRHLKTHPQGCERGHNFVSVICFPKDMRAFTLSLVVAATMFGQNSLTAGRLHIDPPTLENLGFWWPISGDANRNGRA